MNSVGKSLFALLIFIFIFFGSSILSIPNVGLINVKAMSTVVNIKMTFQTTANI